MFLSRLGISLGLGLGLVYGEIYDIYFFLSFVSSSSLSFSSIKRFIGSENDYTRTIKRALESAQRKEERFARKDQGVS